MVLVAENRRDGLSFVGRIEFGEDRVQVVFHRLSFLKCATTVRSAGSTGPHEHAEHFLFALGE